MSDSNTYENPNTAAKKRQNAIAVGAVLGFAGLIWIGLTLTDDSKPQQTVDVAAKKAEEVKQISSPGSTANPSQVWMARSANEIDSVKKQVADLSSQLEKQAALSVKMDEQNKLLLEAQRKLEEERIAIEKSKTESPSPSTAVTVDTNTPSAATAQPTQSSVRPPFTPMQQMNTPPSVQVNTQYYGQPQQTNTNNGVVQGNGYPPGLPNALTPQRRGGVVVSELKPKLSKVSEVENNANSPKPKRRKASDFLTSTTFTKATVLGGMYAPTGGQAQQNPAPVLFLVSDLSQMPNEYQADLKGCMVLGSAVGDKTTERAKIRLMNISCVNQEDEEVISEPVTGYALGEDSMEGIRGQMIVRSGDSLSMAIMADVVGGFGRQLQYQSMQTSITPFGQTSTIDPGKALESGAGAGFGQAAQRLSQYYIKLAEDLFPVIEINALRTAHLVFTKGVDLMADYKEPTNTINDGFAGIVNKPTPPIYGASNPNVMMGQMAGNAIASQLSQQNLQQ